MCVTSFNLLGLIVPEKSVTKNSNIWKVNWTWEIVYWKFHSPTRACNSEVTDPIRPEFELIWDFMPVLVTSKFDEDPIRKEQASLETPFSHYMSYGKFFRCSRAANSIVTGPIWPKFELIWNFMHILVTCKYKKNWIKNNREKVKTSFSPLYVNGRFLLPWKPEFWSNLSRNLMQPFPHPNDASYKIWSTLANWPQRYSSFIWIMTERRNDRTTEFWKDKANPV